MFLNLIWLKHAIKESFTLTKTWRNIREAKLYLLLQKKIMPMIAERTEMCRLYHYFL